MGYGLRRNKVEGGSGGKRGHSNMVHWEYTEEIKQPSRKGGDGQPKLLNVKRGRYASDCLQKLLLINPCLARGFCAGPKKDFCDSRGWRELGRD